MGEGLRIINFFLTAFLILISSTAHAQLKLEKQSMPATIRPFQAVTPDEYEPDDTLSDANEFIIESTVQHHNFDVAGDEDWVKFSCKKNEVYGFVTTELDADCDTVLELYDTTGANLLAIKDTVDTPQAIEYFKWTCPVDGIYYLKVRHHDPEAYGPDTGYDLNIAVEVGGIPGGLNGFVFDPYGNGIDGARIESSSGDLTVYTLDDGHYEIALPSGTYSITVTATGYDTQTQDGVVVPAEGFTILYFEMSMSDDTDTDTDNGAIDNDDGGGDDGDGGNYSDTGCFIAAAASGS